MSELSRVCWLYDGHLNAGGYGRSWHLLVHRASYEAHYGPIPPGLHVDHTCRVRSCYNPSHLEPVTQDENNKRAGAAVTHCPQGHEYSEENTYRSPKGERRCMECNRIRGRVPHVR